MRRPEATNPPERIWLQVGDIEEDCPFSDLSEVTWCQDNQFETDIEYRLVKHKQRKTRLQGKPGYSCQ